MKFLSKQIVKLTALQNLDSYISQVQPLSTIVAVLLALFYLPAQEAVAQTTPLTPATQAAAETPVEKNDKLKVSINKAGEISAQATKVKTVDLANELSRKLRVPVVLSALMRTQSLTFNFEDLPLESALPEIAPHVYVDYVFSQKKQGEPRVVAIYLNGYNEKEPTTRRSVGNESSALVIEGDTESTEAMAANEEPLKIDFADNRLSVSARRQNLSYLISQIALRAGFGFDFKYDSEQLVDAEINEQPLLDALVKLSPFVRVYQRKDLLTGKTTVFKVELSGAATADDESIKSEN